MAYSPEKDLYPFIGTDEDTDIMLFFTDGKGEPKKLNVRRCIEENVVGNGHGYDDGSDDLKEFLVACPKAPNVPIQFSWNKNLQIESNFIETDGFQFAYQNVYKDGFISSLSVYSEIAFPPEIQNLGAASLTNRTIESECILQIPKQSNEIEKIRILFREGNSGAFKIMDEVFNYQPDTNFDENPDFDLVDDGDILGYYTFRNNSIYPILPTKQSSKNFDNLPRKAVSQSVSGNRLMYGNYLDGFNEVGTQATVDVLFADVDQVAAQSEGGGQIIPINVFTDNQRNGGSFGTSIGFSVDVGEQNIKPGVYTLSINMSPERNYHLFNARSYKPSKNIYFNGENGFALEGAAAGQGNEASGPFSIEPGPSQVSTAGTSFIYGYDPTREGVAEISWFSDDGLPNIVQIGTTPANPLILPGAPINIDLVFTVSNEIPPYVLMTSIKEAIESGTVSNQYVQLVSYTGEDLSEYTFTTEELARTSGTRVVVECNSAVESRDNFAANSALADRVCFVPWQESLGDDGGIVGAPAGFFIVKSSKMLLNVKEVGGTGGSSTDPLFGITDPDSTTKAHFRFELAALIDNEFYTCLPEPSDGLGFAYYDFQNAAFPALSPSLMPFGLAADLQLQDSSGENFAYYLWPQVRGAFNGNAYYEGYGVTYEDHAPYGANQFNNGTYIVANNLATGVEVGTNILIYTNYGDPQLGPVYGFTANVTAISYDFDNFDYIVTIDESSMEWLNGEVFNEPNPDPPGPYIQWIHYPSDYANQGNYDVIDPTFPNQAAIYNRDGVLQSMNNQLQGFEEGAWNLCPIAIAKWWAYSAESMQNDDWKDDFTYSFLNQEGQSVSFAPIDTSTWVPPMSKYWEGRWVGGTALDNLAIPTSGYSGGETFISIIDGDGGIGGLIDSGENGFSKISENEVYFSLAEGDSIDSVVVAQGVITPRPANTGAARPVSNRRGSVWNTTLIGLHESFKYLNSDASPPVEGVPDATAYKSPSSPSEADKLSAPLQDLGSYLDVGTEGSAISSFKTRDYHDFGIVYFDHRGRAGTVNRLPAAYVPGYSPSERDSDQKGAVAIRYRLEHLPPDWAESYKIVYAGSSNTQRFIQYSSGGAYVQPNILGASDDKIYVSLNYLQGNRASYAKSYGAKDKDTGEPTLYRYTPGDKLRVISYFTDDTTIKYAPKNYEFDVLGVEEISIEQDNPLIFDDGASEPEDLVPRTGSFVLLRNNINADGFTAADVSGGVDKWGDRCIIEIVTPRKTRGEEIVPYYETPFGGKIIYQQGVKMHQYGTITIDQGDVYFRKVPVNIRDYNDATGSFTDIISVNNDTAEETSVSRFRPYFLESESVTDLFRSVSKSYGKIHFNVDGARERTNNSSIIYSDPTNQESFNLFYTSFSPLESNYYDLPNKYGNIDYMADAGDSIFIAQNSKIGIIQVDKSLTTSASGVDTLNISSDVLSSPRFFTEDVGTDGNPESVTWDDSTLYFVDKSKGVVASASNRGMKFLSSSSMKRFFKDFFSGYQNNSRITTGVNPFTNELIVSAMNSNTTNEVPSGGIDFIERHGINTFSYDLASESWTTGYSFFSSCYANVSDDLISFKRYVVDNKDPNPLKWKFDNVWIHKSGAKNTFYDVQYPSIFKSVAASTPNMTKDYKSISIDGNSPWTLYLNTDKESANIYSFKEYEGTYYSEIPRSESESSKNNYKAVGLIQDIIPFEGEINGIDMTNMIYDLVFDRDITQYHITLSKPGPNRVSEGLFLTISTISVVPASPFLGINDVATSCSPIEIVDKNTLRIQFETPLSQENSSAFLNLYSNNRTFVVKSYSRSFGDSLRDKYLTVTASIEGKIVPKAELYSINIDYIESKLDSSR